MGRAPHTSLPLQWRNILAVLIMLSCITSANATNSTNHWQNAAKAVSNHLHTGLQQYQSGDTDSARRSIVKAYFGAFEGSKMEAAMRMELGAKHAYRVERQFGALRKLIKAGVPTEELKLGIEQLDARLLEDATQLDAAQIPPEVFRVNQ